MTCFTANESPGAWVQEHHREKAETSCGKKLTQGTTKIHAKCNWELRSHEARSQPPPNFKETTLLTHKESHCLLYATSFHHSLSPECALSHLVITGCVILKNCTRVNHGQAS